MSNSYYNFSGNFIPGNLARAEAVSAEFNAVAQGFSKLSIQGVDTGTVNHVVFATTGYPVAAYNDGNNLQFRVLFSNTGPTDINVNGIGVVPLLRFNGNPLVAGDLSAGSWYIAIYEAAFGGFTILSPAAYSTFAGSISLAAPTFKVGLVAAAGASTAAAPIDVKFAIDQSIAPTWTGLHTFTSTVGAIALGAQNTNKLSGEPFHMLEITQLNTTSDQPSIALNAYGPTSGGLFANEIHYVRANGTMAAPTALLSGDYFGSAGGRGWDGTANLSQSSVGIQMQANENWDSTHHGSLWNFFVTPSGGSVARINTLQMSSTVAGGNQFDVMTSGTGDSSVGLLRFMDQGGTRYGYMGKSAAGVITYESDAKLSIQANGGADKLEISTGHALTYNGVAVLTGSGAVTSITGTANQIAASASTGAVTLSLPNNVVIPTVSSGIALTAASSVASTATVSFTASGLGAYGLVVDSTNVNTGGVIYLSNSGTLFGGLESGKANSITATLGDFCVVGVTNNLILATGTTPRITISQTGTVVIAAPSSGQALTITAATGATGVAITGSASNYALVVTASGASSQAIGIVGTGAGSVVITINTTATTGAQTATFAATNKPGSGTTGPTSWIPVSIDSTTKYIPCWA